MAEVERPAAPKEPPSFEGPRSSEEGWLFMLGIFVDALW